MGVIVFLTKLNAFYIRKEFIGQIHKNKNKNFYCPIEGPQGAKSLQ